MSQELRACKNDLLTEEQRFWKDTWLSPDAFQAAKEAHAVVYAYQRRHLKTEPYNGFPVEVVPAWAEYAEQVHILNEPAPAEGEY